MQSEQGDGGVGYRCIVPLSSQLCMLQCTLAYLGAAGAPDPRAGAPRDVSEMAVADGAPTSANTTSPGFVSMSVGGARAAGGGLAGGGPVRQCIRSGKTNKHQVI